VIIAVLPAAERPSLGRRHPRRSAGAVPPAAAAAGPRNHWEFCGIRPEMDLFRDHPWRRIDAMWLLFRASGRAVM
jgi:hypothetical protein